MQLEELPQNALLAFPGNHSLSVVGRLLLVCQIGTVEPSTRNPRNQLAVVGERKLR